MEREIGRFAGAVKNVSDVRIRKTARPKFALRLKGNLAGASIVKGGAFFDLRLKPEAVRLDAHLVDADRTLGLHAEDKFAAAIHLRANVGVAAEAPQAVHFARDGGFVV
jgi:hypothetical protein